jgi:ATP-dependent RNA helicase DDX18/HAS1
MGIKGRRKKLRAREERGGEIDPSTIADPELRELALAGELPEGLIHASQMKMKKSELYALQDTDILEQMQEEHRNRRMLIPHSKRHRTENQDTLEATASPNDAYDDADAPGVKQSNRSKVVNGPPFAHALLGLDTRLTDALTLAGFSSMTPVQARAIPLAMQSYDMLGQAKTGSGKTLAFGVPLLNQAVQTLSLNPSTFVALVLSPTKELCAQICAVLSEVSRFIQLRPGKRSATDRDVRVELITGGTKIQEERKRLLLCNIAIGTPGRVLDHVQHTPAWTIRSSLTHFVMDEADRLLADGFQRDIDAILSALPPQRQTFLFSATNSKSVRELARLSLSQSPLFVSTKGDAPQALDGSGAAPPYTDFDGGMEHEHDGGDKARDEEAIPSSLKQFCQIVPVHERLRALYVFIKRVCKTRKAMVFCSTVASAQFHCMIMGAAGFHDDVLMLHGKMKHRQRLATFEAFQAWDSGVLFCTDVAARGLDIPKVDWILQYDPPMDPTEYVHRIGRTARAGAVGSALMFVSPEEQPFVAYLSKYGMKLDVLPQEPVPDIQLSLQRILELDPIVAKNAVNAFRAHVAAYQSHVLSTIFDVHQLNLEDLAISFALTAVPNVTLPKSTQEEKTTEYVKASSSPCSTGQTALAGSTSG